MKPTLVPKPNAYERLRVLDDEALAKAQADYAAALERIRAHAEFQFRGIKDPGRHDDAIANAVGIGWKHWLSALRHGKDPNEFISVIADKAVRQVRAGRRVDRQERKKDVLSNLPAKGFFVERLAGPVAPGQEPIDAVEDRLADNTRTPPPEQAAFREQFGILLHELGPRKRPIVEDMALGTATSEIAAKHRVTPGRISQLRREAEQAWLELDRDGEERGR